ncbi:hypothetical protein J4218_00760 [Candidatus Pacearchaeota archaeon]|nr:hypothetical protein [Candidatus Pacearchaeota archaeon]
MKKQIVFIEYTPSVPTIKIARTLKLTGNYETILVSFRKKEEEFLGKAFDRVIFINLTHKLNKKNIINFFKNIFSKGTRNALKELRALDPYIFQITGPDLFTLISTSLINKKSARIYFAYDIWKFFEKKWSFKNIGIKELFQKVIEKRFFNICDGILHKGPEDEFKYLDYKISVPSLCFYPGCLDEWIIPVKKNKKIKNIKLVYAGGPLAAWNGRVAFIDVTKEITKQGIYFSTSSKPIIEKDSEIFFDEEKRNPYFKFGERGRSEYFSKNISKYDYGIIPDFFDTSIINPLWPKTSMANKLFTYIEAGIPIIINEQSEVMADVVKNNSIGIVIKYEELKNLKKIILKKDYNKLLKNMKKTQERYRLSKNIHLIEEFYEKCYNLKHIK